MPETITLAAVAKLAGIHRVTVFRWASHGLLGPVTGKPKRVELAKVLELIGGREEAQLRNVMSRRHGKAQRV